MRTQTRFRPDRLASYIISSATAMRSAGDCTPGWGVPATPTLMVTRIGLPSYENAWVSTRLAQALGHGLAGGDRRCRAR